MYFKPAIGSNMDTSKFRWQLMILMILETFHARYFRIFLSFKQCSLSHS